MLNRIDQTALALFVNIWVINMSQIYQNGQIQQN